MHLVLFLDFQKHPMRRGAQNMPVCKARGRGDLKGQKEKNTGTGLYKHDWLPNMGGGFREICPPCRKNGRILG